jgi:hypothetical protein
MTQTKLFKIARATVVLVFQLAWVLVKVVLLAAAAVLRGVANGPAPRQDSESDPKLVPGPQDFDHPAHRSIYRD